MKVITKVLFALFFIIAIGVHIKSVIEGDDKPFWWHGLYFITYGTCWWMLFSENKLRAWIFAFMAIFPFSTHAYYGYLHFSKLDMQFWICVLVCATLILGFWKIRNEKIKLRNEQKIT